MYSQLLVLWWGQTNKILNIGGKICGEIGGGNQKFVAGGVRSSKGSSSVQRSIRGGGTTGNKCR